MIHAAALSIRLNFPSLVLAASASALRSTASYTRAFASSAASMSVAEYDLVTLGAGSGGTRASRFAAQYYNAKVACVELPFGFVSSGEIGGELLYTE
jgi:hypothetical protein